MLAIERHIVITLADAVTVLAMIERLSGEKDRPISKRSQNQRLDDIHARASECLRRCRREQELSGQEESAGV